MTRSTSAGMKLGTLLGVLLISTSLRAQVRKIEPSWLHRYVPQSHDANVGLSSESCHYRPIFGEGDADSR
ncbi:MAG: hypothetical protein ACRD41_15345, partial [Candidatus Acidiferrales bacterium]